MVCRDHSIHAVQRKETGTVDLLVLFIQNLSYLAFELTVCIPFELRDLSLQQTWESLKYSMLHGFRVAAGLNILAKSCPKH